MSSLFFKLRTEIAFAYLEFFRNQFHIKRWITDLFADNLLRPSYSRIACIRHALCFSRTYLSENKYEARAKGNDKRNHDRDAPEGNSFCSFLDIRYVERYQHWFCASHPNGIIGNSLQQPRPGLCAVRKSEGKQDRFGDRVYDKSMVPDILVLLPAYLVQHAFAFELVRP